MVKTPVSSCDSTVPKKPKNLKGFYTPTSYVPKSELTENDFIVLRGGGNQHRIAHQDLYKQRDAIYVSNNYPSLKNLHKHDCQRMLLDHFKSTGGRMLKPVGHDGYYTISERMERKVIAAKFRPSPHRKIILDKLIHHQSLEQQPPIAPMVIELPNHNTATTPTLDHNNNEAVTNHTFVDDVDDDEEKVAPSETYNEYEEKTLVYDNGEHHETITEVVEGEGECLNVEYIEENECGDFRMREIDIIDFNEFIRNCTKQVEERNKNVYQWTNYGIVVHGGKDLSVEGHHNFKCSNNVSSFEDLSSINHRL